MGVPPFRGEGVEVGDFCRVDRAAGLAIVEVVGGVESV